MKVIFDIEKQPGTNLIVYPDDVNKFSNTDARLIPGKIIADYTGDVVLQLYTDDNLPTYTNAEFMQAIDPALIDAINASVDETVILWRNNMQGLDVVDFGNLPKWFLEGVDTMRLIGIITKEDIDAFLWF